MTLEHELNSSFRFVVQCVEANRQPGPPAWFASAQSIGTAVRANIVAIFQARRYKISFLIESFSSNDAYSDKTLDC